MMRNKMGFDIKYYRGKADRDQIHSLNDFEREEELGRRIEQVKHECDKIILNYEE